MRHTGLDALDHAHCLRLPEEICQEISDMELALNIETGVKAKHVSAIQSVVRQITHKLLAGCLMMSTGYQKLVSIFQSFTSEPLAGVGFLNKPVLEYVEEGVATSQVVEGH